MSCTRQRCFETIFAGSPRPCQRGPGKLALIAEIKKASPSAGVIVESFDPLAIAKNYARAGVDAISVLTDERFFQGHLDYLKLVRDAVPQPLLRKDFILDALQIMEAAAAGADAILLIVAALKQEQLVALLETAALYQLDALVEVHTLAELDRALETEARIIGINNRNLATFEVDLAVTETSERRSAEGDRAGQRKRDQNGGRPGADQSVRGGRGLDRRGVDARAERDDRSADRAQRPPARRRLRRRRGNQLKD